VWNVFKGALGAADDRSAPFYYASLPGSVANALGGEYTFFSQALIKALSRAASDPELDGFGKQRWPVTVRTLATVLEEELEDLRKVFGGKQELSPVGAVREAVIQWLMAPPQAPLSIGVFPEEAIPSTSLDIRDTQSNALVEQKPPPLDPYPYETVLPMGFYVAVLSCLNPNGVPANKNEYIMARPGARKPKIVRMY
jgi:hypothetical protein